MGRRRKGGGGGTLKLITACTAGSPNTLVDTDLRAISLQIDTHPAHRPPARTAPFHSAGTRTSGLFWTSAGSAARWREAGLVGRGRAHPSSHLPISGFRMPRSSGSAALRRVTTWASTFTLLGNPAGHALPCLAFTTSLPPAGVVTFQSAGQAGTICRSFFRYDDCLQLHEDC